MDFGVVGTLAAAVFGSIVGSFLNVVIHRLPREQSIAFPPSHCPGCGARIRPRDNLPVLGYLLLRGRCRDCRAPISVRYPLVEALTATLAAGLWVKYGPTFHFAVFFVFVTGLVAITFIDLDFKIIPDSLSIGGTVLGFGSSFLTGLGWRASLLGAGVGLGLLLAVAFGYYAVTRREGMGLGDAKLLMAVGAFMGWKAVLFTVFLSSIVGATVGLVLMRVRGADMRFEVPFGPFLALGAVVYVFAGPQLMAWYLGSMG